MLLNWAIAEATSHRRWRYVKHLLPISTSEKIEQKAFESLTQEDQQALITMIRHAREPLLKGLLPIPVTWYLTTLSFEHYMNISICHFPQFIQIAHSDTLIELVEALERGEMSPKHDEFREQLLHLEKHFSMQQMHGVPILVALHNTGPYYLIEGFTRSCAMVMQARKGKQTYETVPVIMGIGKDLTMWFLREHGESTQLIPQK